VHQRPSVITLKANSILSITSHSSYVKSLTTLSVSRNSIIL